jgi:hypothetical protein
MLWRRIADHANWRHVYKARVPQPGSPNGDANTPAHTNARPCTVVQGLVLLEYLCRAGSDQVVADALEHVFDLDALTRYQYINEDGTDVGGNGTHTRSWPRACVGVSVCLGVWVWVAGWAVAGGCVADVGRWGGSAQEGAGCGVFASEQGCPMARARRLSSVQPAPDHARGGRGPGRPCAAVTVRLGRFVVARRRRGGERGGRQHTAGLGRRAHHGQRARRVAPAAAAAAPRHRRRRQQCSAATDPVRH